MSKTINNGGPAFPLPPVSHDGKVVALTEGIAQGMTLRDYFAATALPAVFKDYAESAQKVGWDEGWQDGVAMNAYFMADAMLRARGEA